MLWDVALRDWSGISAAEVVIHRVASAARGGSIVVMRTNQVTANALLRSLARPRAKASGRSTSPRSCGPFGLT